MCKKIIFPGLAALMLFIGGSTMFAQTIVTLDQAISYSISEIESRLAQGVKVMVLNFKSPSERFSGYVLDEMANMLTRNGKLTLVERENLEFILRELRYERSGDINDDAAQSIGRILGAQYVVSGVIEEASANYILQIRTMPVESPALQALTWVYVEKDAQIANLLGAATPGLTTVGTSTLSAAGASTLTGTDTSNVREADTSNFGVAQEYTANARRNWISGEVNFIGVGARYERMLGPKLSLGVNAYWSSLLFLFGGDLGADVSFRFYPWGKTFFMGAGLGFHQHSTLGLVGSRGGAITPELGWKIDVGNAGGFYLQPGVKYPIILFGVGAGFAEVAEGLGVAFGFGVPYLGMGYAF